MNIKQKFAEAKNFVKKNSQTIVPLVCIAFTAGVAAGARHNANDQIKFANEMSGKLKEIKRLVTDLSETERLWISNETEQEILGGSKDVVFDVNGKDFAVVLNPES